MADDGAVSGRDVGELAQGAYDAQGLILGMPAGRADLAGRMTGMPGTAAGVMPG
jgi:hypothetical protein